MKNEPIWTRDFSLLIGGALLQGLSFYFLLPVLPLFVEGPLGKSEALIGVAVAIFSVTAVTVRPLSGFLLDRYGRRGWQLIAAVVFAASMFGYLLVDTFLLLLVVRLIHGLGWGVVHVASATVAADLVPAPRRGEGMGFYGMAMPLALSAGPMLGLLILDVSHFDRLFLACGTLGVLAFLGFFLVRTPRVQNPNARLSLKKIFERRVMPIFFFMLLLCIGYGGVVAFVPLYVPRFGFEGSGPLFTVYAVCVITTRLFGGRWYDRRGPLWPCSTGLAFLICGWLGLGLAASQATLLGSAALLGWGFGLLLPSMQAMTVDLVEPDRRGAANATVFSSFDIGIGIGAVGFGLLAEAVDLPYIFLISGALAAIAAGVFLFSVYPNFSAMRAGDRGR